MQQDTSFIPDLPSGGPLAEYRKRAKFNWKNLRLIFEDATGLKIKYTVWNRLESDPLFRKPSNTESADQQQRIAAMRMNRFTEYQLLPPELHAQDHKTRVSFLS